MINSDVLDFTVNGTGLKRDKDCLKHQDRAKNCDDEWPENQRSLKIVDQNIKIRPSTSPFLY